MRRIPALTIAVLVLVALGAAVAHARIIQAQSVLPPGQSGFVSLAGVANGTGSPHLYDQQPLFTSFSYKTEMFDPPGPSQSPRPGVTISRDGFGVPDVHAGTEDNMWFGAGYAIAQDRLFQLDLFRRATQGRLAEILGSTYLPMDLVSRRDYFTGPELDRMLARVPGPLRARFDAYRDGINAWIAHVRRTPADLPGEFTATNDPLADWTSRDSVAIGIFLARTVPSGDGNELENLAALRSLGAGGFDRLLPLRVPGQVEAVPRQNGLFPSQPGRTRAQERTAYRRSQRAVARMPLPTPGTMTAAARAKRSIAPGMIGQLGGSYMFAVRDRRHHRAELFNGPQLGFSAPELFVELELHGPGLDVRGVTAAGIPLLAIGHNQHVAWGFTSGLSDDNDLYAEKLVPGQSERYTFKGRTRAMSCRDEVFRFGTPPTGALKPLGLLKPGGAGSGSRTERICRTVHGPVQVRTGGVAYARRYAIFGRELETLDGLSRVNTARTVRDVDRALLHVTWNENLVAADDRGHIGYWHPGLHPLRPLGYDERLPYPGTGGAEWRGLLPRRRDPFVIDPKRGWVASWNNVPSAGWTSGDGPARERLNGPFHRAHYLYRLVAALARRPSFAGAKRVIRSTGTVAQQRPLASNLLRRAARGARGRAVTVLQTLLRWKGSYAQTEAKGTVDPGVATWEQFKTEAEKIAVRPLGRIPAPVADGETLTGATSNSHMFDATNGESYALRTLSRPNLQRAAIATFSALSARFKSADPRTWREPRRLYPESAQGAGAPPDLPFFDRGTWEHFVEVGR